MILPSTPAAACQPDAREAATSRADVAVRKSILLVDDDDAVRTVVGEQLREMGFDVDASAPTAPARSSAVDDGGEFDLLLTDFAMPGFNGVQTIQPHRVACARICARR